MYLISDEESINSNSYYSEEVDSEEDSYGHSNYYEKAENEKNYYTTCHEEENVQPFKYVCIASLEDTKILLKYSLYSRDVDISVNHIINNILISLKKKKCSNKKILNWNGRIIYFTICNEKKLVFFLIGHDDKAYFKNYVFEFLKKLELYIKSDLFNNDVYNLNNITSEAKLYNIQSFMKRTIKSINTCCKDEKIIAVKQKLNKINSVMNNHIDNLYQTRRDIKALQYKTENMSKNTLNFVQNSKKLKRMMFFKYWKTYLFLACSIIIGFKIYRSI
ncbi:SNARE protein, putative [Hepatocystis sp. ex Piliocolobus tephrosceles]|nr:SNARE protein, putative [Hepatocystis sp. ex Piliocolobus tephrosceles]